MECNNDYDNQEPLVSVFCATYNHASYIKDAINGFLMQETNFSYEIVIHDDASTDGTTEILQDYEKKYPDLIKVIYEKENQYRKGNPVRFFYLLQKKLRGKYIALCEGDDFWIDSRKLQIQVDYLEENPDCQLTVHNAVKIDERTGSIELTNRYKYDRDLTARNLVLAEKGDLPSASMVYRKFSWSSRENFFLEASVGDYARQLYFFSKGKVHFFDRVMSVYRHMHPGSWSNEQNQKGEERLLHLINLSIFLDKYNEYTNHKYEKYFISGKQFYLDAIINDYSEEQINSFRNKDIYKDKTRIYYLDAISRFYKQRYDAEYCDISTREFVCRYKHIVVMGTGVYGKTLATQLKNNNIHYDGFIVSDDQVNAGNMLEKNIWFMKDLPFEKSETGVLVGINPRKWYEITEILEENEFLNYMCPFIF